MNLLHYPIIWIPAAGLVLAIAFGLAAVKSRGRKRALFAVPAALCVLLPTWLLVAAFAPGLIDARYRAYEAFYNSIQPGMTRFEVLSSLEKHYPTEGPRQRPKIMKDTREEMGFHMNPEDSYEPNCEGIYLVFAEGKVVRKRYSRD